MSAKTLRWAAMALIALALAATYLGLQMRHSVQREVVVEVPSVLGRVGDFELVNRDGARVDSADLRGEPWVADFIFTRCALSCPRLTSLMIRLGEEAPGVRRVSFSVDPEHDTVPVLADYAESYGVRDPDWLFLTGGREEVEALVIERFMLPIVSEPPPELARPEEPILHSNRFVLVDAAGAIRGYYEVTDPTDFGKLLVDLAALGGDRDSRSGARADPEPAEPSGA